MIADHVEEVVGGHQPALFLVAAALLQQRVQRHRKQPAEEPDQREVDRRAARTSRRSRRAAIAKTPMPIAPIGARPSSTLSPDSRPAAMLPTPMPIAANVVRMPTQRSLEAHDLGAEQDHHQLQQRTEEPEVGDADHRQPQHAVAPQARSDRAQISPHGFQSKRLPGRGRRDARNAQARRRAEHRDADDERRR